jgi:hypothetical protein
MSRIWLVYGPAYCLAELWEGSDNPNDDGWWTIHRDAQIGDGVLFYLKSPICGIVASGRVVSKPKRDRKAEHWSRVMPYGCSIEVDRKYDPPIGYHKMVQDAILHKNWGVLRAQMQSATGPQLVPSIVIERLMKKYELVIEE